MKTRSLLWKGLAICLLAVLQAASSPARAHAGPFDGKQFRGTIAWTADGNHNDEDDWAAAPLALALLAEFGVKNRLVHFGYNNILEFNDAAWAEEHRRSNLKAVELWGFDPSCFYDCQRNLELAIESLAKAIEGASAEQPLYLVVAGPVEVLYRALKRTRAEKRQFVYCISHSRWNDGFARRYKFAYTKRAIIESGVNWVQIPDQNKGLATSPWGRAARPEEWEPWRWLERSHDLRLQFLWERLQKVKRADASDAGMAWFLLTGDEHATVEKIKAMLEGGERPQPVQYRRKIRLEAENFAELAGFDLVDTDREASHRLHVQIGTARGALKTRYSEPYTPSDGLFHASLRYRSSGECAVDLTVSKPNQTGRVRLPPAATWRNWQLGRLELQERELLGLQLLCSHGGAVEIDYVELELLQPLQTE